MRKGLQATGINGIFNAEIEVKPYDMAGDRYTIEVRIIGVMDRFIYGNIGAERLIPTIETAEEITGAYLKKLSERGGVTAEKYQEEMEKLGYTV